MSHSIKRTLPVALAILLVSAPASAEPASGSFELSWFDNALSLAQKFRLVFTTSSKTDAQSSQGSSYDSVVAADAASGSLTGLAPLDAGWKAIVSTASGENAAVRTGTTTGTASDVAILRIDGSLIANSYADFWDGSLVNQMNVTEDGETITTGKRVWTGTNEDGTSASGEELGSAGGSRWQTGESIYGQTNQTDEDAFNKSESDNDNEYRLYAISDVYQWNGELAMLANEYEPIGEVHNPPSNMVPEPTALATFLVLMLGTMMTQRRLRPAMSRS